MSQVFAQEVGFSGLISSTELFLKNELQHYEISEINASKMIEKLLDQGGFAKILSKKLSPSERAQYVNLLMNHREKINDLLKSYAMSSVLNDFMTRFWFRNGEKKEEDFDTSLFWELISLDLPNIDFKSYQTSRGVTIQSIVSTLYAAGKNSKVDAKTPLQKFLRNYLRKEIKYCETLHDMMSGLPTHPAVAEIKEVLDKPGVVNFPAIIDSLLSGNANELEKQEYYRLLAVR